MSDEAVNVRLSRSDFGFGDSRHVRVRGGRWWRWYGIDNDTAVPMVVLSSKQSVRFECAIFILFGPLQREIILAKQLLKQLFSYLFERTPPPPGWRLPC